MKKAGAAVQSGVYRTTLAAVLVCPIASAIVAAAGYDGLTLPPDTVRRQSSARGPGDRRFARVDRCAGAEPRDPLTAVVDQAEPPATPVNEAQPEPIVSTETVASPPAAISLSAQETVPAIVLTVWLLGVVVMARGWSSATGGDAAEGDGGSGRAWR